jgi:hypothetical protein
MSHINKNQFLVTTKSLVTNNGYYAWYFDEGIRKKIWNAGAELASKSNAKT